MSNTNQYYMQLALEEALKGKTNTYPNPRVGAIVVSNEKVVSTGYHHHYRGPHAEAIAISKLKGAYTDATLYVTLEPCAHQGQNEPCTGLIDPKVFSKVVIGAKDPNKLAAGGSEQLLKKGIDVIGPVSEDECKDINRRFFTFHEKKRPYIILKVALTMDGFIAEEDGRSKWITNDRSRESVHILRSNCDAIIVGNNTIEKDDPNLTSHGKGKDPKIILFDKKFQDRSQMKVSQQDPIIIKTSDMHKDPKENLDRMIEYLYKNSFQTLLVEGGGVTLTHFLNANLYDELHVYYAPKIIGKGLQFYHGKRSLEQELDLNLARVEKFGNDIKLTYIKK